MHKARNRLLALLSANSNRPKRYEIQQQADEATIYLYDAIDAFWGVSAAQFVRDLNAIKAGTIHLRINSPGGDVFEGRAIATAIAQHPSNVIAHIDGLAASAASFVALAAREVEMAPGSFMMIHRAWTLAFGNAEDLRGTAELLEKVDESILDSYIAETGNSREQLREWVDAETWFTADEAVSNGFADRVAEGAASAKNHWNLAEYNTPPANLQNAADDEQIEAEHADRKRRIDFLTSFA